MPLNYDNEAIIRVEYAMDGVLRMRTVLEIVADLENALARHNQVNGRPKIDLAFYCTSRGSFIFDMVGLVGTMCDLYDKRMILGSFIRHMAETAEFMFRGFTKQGLATAPDLTAVQTLIGPLASGEAKEVNVFLLTGNSTLTINHNELARSDLFGARGAFSPAKPLRKDRPVTLVGYAIHNEEGWSVGPDFDEKGIPLVIRSPILLEAGRLYRLSGNYEPGTEKAFAVVTSLALNPTPPPTD